VSVTLLCLVGLDAELLESRTSLLSFILFIVFYNSWTLSGCALTELEIETSQN